MDFTRPSVVLPICSLHETPILAAINRRLFTTKKFSDVFVAQ